MKIIDITYLSSQFSHIIGWRRGAFLIFIIPQIRLNRMLISFMRYETPISVL